jgi:hypothetical protein
MTQHASRQQSGASKASWLDRAVDIFKRQPDPPPKPATPRVNLNLRLGNSIDQTLLNL